MTHDYTRKKGVVHSEIMLPDHAPPNFSDRSTLWNAVEKIEKAKNSQLAREIEVSLPRELSFEENLSLAREYIRKNFVNEGMCADFAIHDKGDGNPHCHIMLTMRPLNLDGSWGDKQKKEYLLNSNGEKIYDPKKRQYKCRTIQTTDWNNRANSEEWRQAWADEVNAFLLQKNLDEQIDHRSYERQGIEQVPTVHMGAAAHQMELKGIQTEKGDINRGIHEENKLIKLLKSGIEKFKNSIADLFSRKAEIEKEINEQPRSENLITKLIRFNNNGFEFAKSSAPYLRNLKSNRSLKNVATAIAFLQTHSINTIEELQAKLTESKTRHSELRQSTKIKTSRKSELSQLLESYRTYKEYKPILEEYQSIKSPKKQSRFYESHRMEITLCESARKKLPDKLTPKAWTRELETITAELANDNGKRSLFEDNIAQMETIIKNMDSLDRYENIQEYEQQHRKIKYREEESL